MYILAFAPHKTICFKQLRHFLSIYNMTKVYPESTVKDVKLFNIFCKAKVIRKDEIMCNEFTSAS